MTLHTLIASLEPLCITGTTHKDLSALTEDSRQVITNACYIALEGTHIDGHDFIAQAIEKGASVIIAQNPAPQNLSPEITWVQFKDTNKALPVLARTWYHNPSTKLKVVGVTGTNGKTTTTYVIHALMERVWHRAGLIGTIEFNDGLRTEPATHTTPGSLKVNELLEKMVKNDCRGVAMEVSSHALSQNRIDDIAFDVALFTNFTQDHLDYHKTMEEYFLAKKSFFERLVELKKNHITKKPVAIFNVDSQTGFALSEEFCSKLNVITYGLSAKAQMRAIPRIMTLVGSEFEVHYKNKAYRVKTPLVGQFNLLNALAGLATAVALGIPLREAVAALAELPQVPGRLELLRSPHNIHGFVDYAHTPDALENVCKTLKELHSSGRLIVVFGCGGDRDAQKRPLMGEMVEKYADIAIVTSDNPRSENPEAIIKDILPGLREGMYRITPDRKEAIRFAVEIAKPGDCILVAGKGHEDYQELATGKIPFNDKVALRMCLENWGNA